MSVDQLRRRHAAAVRLPVLDDGRRDPDAPPVQHGPSTFGLTVRELRRHAADLQHRGWTVAEIRTVLDLDAPEPHCPCCPRAAVSA